MWPGVLPARVGAPGWAATLHNTGQRAVATVTRRGPAKVSNLTLCPVRFGQSTPATIHRPGLRGSGAQCTMEASRPGPLATSTRRGLPSLGA